MDHDEDYRECLERELAEEMSAKVKSIGPLAFFYRHESQHGHPKVSLAFPVQLASSADFAPGSDDLEEARFVSQEELLQLPFQKSEAPIKQHAEQIWHTAQTVEKNTQNS